MGVADASENAWWWSVLMLGAGSPFAESFDIDWEAGGGRLLIPVLGETLEQAAATGALRIEGDELRYHEHRYPLAPGSARRRSRWPSTPGSTTSSSTGAGPTAT